MTDTIVPQSAPPSRRGSSRPTSRPVVAGVAAIAVLALLAVGYEVTKGGSSQTPQAAPVTRSAPVATTVAPPATPQALLRAATADALSSGAVRLSIRNVTSGGGVSKVTSIDMTSSGLQRITVHGEVLLAQVDGRETYFSGNARGLTKSMGFRPALASQIAGHWVQLSPGEPGYSSVRQQITLPSVMHLVVAISTLHKKLLHSTKDGLAVVGIVGRPTNKHAGRHASAVLWVTAGANPLPVEVDERNNQAKSVAKFSRWGDMVTLAAPPAFLTLTHSSSAQSA